MKRKINRKKKENKKKHKKKMKMKNKNYFSGQKCSFYYNNTHTEISSTTFKERERESLTLRNWVKYATNVNDFIIKHELYS